MKLITLIINRRNVELRIQTHTFYTGEARREAGAPAMLAARFQASDNDLSQLSDHIQMAIDELASLLTKYLSLCTSNMSEYEEDGKSNIKYIFTLSVPPNFPLECIQQIENTMESYAVTRTLQLWTAQHKPDETPLAAGEAERLMMQMRQLMAMRQRPKRTYNCDKNIIDI